MWDSIAEARPYRQGRRVYGHGGLMALSIGDFGRLLAAKRGSRGVRAAALEADVSTSTYSRVENGYMPDLETFAKLCRWLGRDPGEFLGFKAEEGSDTQQATVVHFKKKKTVSVETATALGELILAAQRAIRAREDLIGR
jgi:transcriptional regulator with XRE-family HTH domain